MNTEDNIKEIPIDDKGYPTIRRYYTTQHCPKCADILVAQWLTHNDPKLGYWEISCAICSYEPFVNSHYTRELPIIYTLTLQPPPKTDRFFHETCNLSHDKLYKMCRSTLSELCKTGGGSFLMSTPPRIDDTDILFYELLARFDGSLRTIEDLRVLTHNLSKELEALKEVSKNQHK